MIVFEEIEPHNALEKHHVLLYELAPILDLDVPLLKQKADDYDKFTMDVHHGNGGCLGSYP